MVEKVLEMVAKELKDGGCDCFVSERHFQVVFTAMAMSLYGDDYFFYPEYTPEEDEIPSAINAEEKFFGTAKDKGFQFTTMHFDLLIREKETLEDTIIEFKYKTKKSKVKIYGKTIELSTHNDTKNGRFAVWADAERIYQFVNSDKDYKVKNGFVIFVTNYLTYLEEPENNSTVGQFSLKTDNREQRDTTRKDWKIGDEERKNPTGLPIQNQRYLKFGENIFDLKPKDYLGDKENPFKVLIIEIPPTV